jgi:pyruvate kinase
VKAPALIWLHKDGSAIPVDKASTPRISLDEGWLSQCQEGDRICLVDARGASRRLTVCEATELGCLAISQQTIYFVPGLKLTLKRKRNEFENPSTVVSENMPCKEGAIRLNEGDLLVLSGKPIVGSNAQHDIEGKLTQPACISISIPSVLDDVRAGEPVWFDDGKIGGTIEDVRAGEALLRITLARTAGDVLRAEKGINLPDTNLHLPALSSQDLEDLKFVVQHADMVGLSLLRMQDHQTKKRSLLRRLGIAQRFFLRTDKGSQKKMGA